MEVVLALVNNMCVCSVFVLLCTGGLYFGTFITYRAVFYHKDIPSSHVEANNKYQHSSPNSCANKCDLRHWQK